MHMSSSKKLLHGKTELELRSASRAFTTKPAHNYTRITYVGRQCPDCLTLLTRSSQLYQPVSLNFYHLASLTLSHHDLDHHCILYFYTSIAHQLDNSSDFEVIWLIEPRDLCSMVSNSL